MSAIFSHGNTGLAGMRLETGLHKREHLLKGSLKSGIQQRVFGIEVAIETAVS